MVMIPIAPGPTIGVYLTCFPGDERFLVGILFPNVDRGGVGVMEMIGVWCEAGGVRRRPALKKRK